MQAGSRTSAGGRTGAVAACARRAARAVEHLGADGADRGRGPLAGALRSRWHTVSLSALALLATSAAHAAGPKPEDAVHYREGIMMAMAWNVGPMGAMVKGDIPFDAGRFAFLAGRVATLAPMALEGFTPDTQAVESEAKPALWDNFADFEQRMGELEQATARLADVAQSGDESAMKSEFVTAAKVCKGCHDEYQEEH